MEKNIELITNNNWTKTYELIKNLLDECISFKFNVSFITWGGFQILAQVFKKIDQKNITGKIITTSYQYFTDPKVMSSFKNEFKNFEIKVIDKKTINNKEIGDSFHPKGYIFEFEDHYKILIGSANMTEKALKTNIEWSLLIEHKKNESIVKNILEEFDYLWKNTDLLTDEFINEYKNKYIFEKNKKFLSSSLENLNINEEIVPNEIQNNALINLRKLRENGENKALVIAATGVGKTFLSAFDVKNFNSKKTLFVAHREEILNKSKESFDKVLKNNSSTIFKGINKNKDANIVFASHQTLHRNLNLFDENEFDYIIIDEAHHAAAETYLKVIKHFRPKFLLGMTATPERMDGLNIFELFDENIAIEIRLKDAIKRNLITSFHYFGIKELNTIDLSNVNIENLDEVAKKLMINERVDYIIEQIKLFKYDGDKMFCLAFCATKKHAEFMSKEFNKRNILAKHLTSDIKSEERIKIINEFQDSQSKLEVLFVVDIFNEGVDIPKINLVLFLRPTNSPIIFLQQLGRGLRKYSSKGFLTVLDFIANHKKNYLIPYTFSTFNNVINENYLENLVKNDFKSLPEIHIEFDQISKINILEKIKYINVNSKKWINDEYFQFKQSRNNKIPYYMCDYLIENAPNVIKFAKKEKNYLSFLSTVENEYKIRNLLTNQSFNNYLIFLTKLLPIYRANEFALIEYSIKKNVEKIELELAKNIINFYTKETSEWSIRHTMNYFKKENECKNLFFKIENDSFYILENFRKIFSNDDYKKYILDIVEFGLRFFQMNYNLEKYIFPFIKIGQKYRQKEILYINQDESSLNSLFGKGVYFLNNNFYIFIDLIKNENIKESLKYENEIMSRKYIKWDSQNSSTQDKGIGYKLVNHAKLNHDIHVFVRKNKKIDNVTQPFFYLGKANVVDAFGNKPIKFKLKLENLIKDEIFYELN